MVKAGKLLLGTVLLPACVAATLVLRREILVNLRAELYFLAGLFSYLVLLAIFQQPIRTYIFGHELTHAFWVWFFGGRVKGFKAASAGGQVQVTKSNFLIFLAPYFFPIYSILAILIYLLLSLLFNFPAGLRVLSFMLGFTWAFHITFTVYVLIQGQPDIWATGRIFSLPLIYFANIVVLAFLIIFVSPALSYGKFMENLVTGIKDVYLYLWNNGPGFCRECYGWCKERLEEISW